VSPPLPLGCAGGLKHLRPPSNNTQKRTNHSLQKRTVLFVTNKIAIVGTGDAAKIYQSTPTSVHDFSRAVHVWVDVNEKRLHAISGVEGDEAETKVKEELTKLQGELRAAVGELEKRIANIHEERQGFLPAAYRGTQAAEREPASAPREEAAVVPDAGSYTPAPEKCLGNLSSALFKSGTS
jgi:hypothetical protein